MASVTQLELRRLSVAEYHRMIEAGVFDEDERLELLEGVIVRMSPQKERHARAIQRLTRTLVRTAPESLWVRVQLPLTLGSGSEPEPDLAVVAADQVGSRDEHPRSALLVVEVAADSLGKDRSVKVPLYARSGIPEYWIVNLVDECVEVHRDPDARAERYATVLTFRHGNTLSSPQIAGLTLSVDDLLS
jgi:Uma2 family endonuclease